MRSAVGFLKDHRQENPRSQGTEVWVQRGALGASGRGELESPEMETPSYREPDAWTRKPWAGSQRRTLNTGVRRKHGPVSRCP